jgi:hypothetical protein
MQIKCTKILKYNLYPKATPLENFEYINKVLDQSIDPPSTQAKSLILDSDVILCSTLNRARECLKTSSKVLYMPELKEIPMDLSSVCTLADWSKKNSAIVRQKFKEAFIKDELAISRKQLRQEADKIFEACNNYKSVTIVSHTFRLILLKAIYETKGKIISNPELIHNYIDNNKHILDFGESFYLN